MATQKHNRLLKCLLLFLICLCFAKTIHAAPVINIALTASEKRTVTYKKGQKIQLTRKGIRIRNATYKSSNTSVATVSSTGLIRTKQAGKTTIYISRNGITAKYRLKVTDNSTIYDYANKYGRNMRYFIHVNRSEHIVYVLKKSYGEYRLLKKFPCCVGAPSTPTPAGDWSIRGKGTYFITSGGSKCWYFSQFLGSYLFHSQIYSSASSPSYLVDGSMGVSCSHGCIRLYLSDAKWIYDTIPYGTRVYII